LGAASRALDRRRDLAQLVLAAREQQNFGASGGHRPSRGGAEAAKAPVMSTVLPASLIVTHLYLGQTARRNPPHKA
jgi:hypothetical protein